MVSTYLKANKSHLCNIRLSKVEFQPPTRSFYEMTCGISHILSQKLVNEWAFLVRTAQYNNINIFRNFNRPIAFSIKLTMRMQ